MTDQKRKPVNYFSEALKAIVGKRPPMKVPRYSSTGMGDDVLKLQDWCSENARPKWSTGIGILEAAELIVQEAVANANIPPENGDW